MDVHCRNTVWVKDSIPGMAGRHFNILHIYWRRGVCGVGDIRKSLLLYNENSFLMKNMPCNL